MKKKLLCTMFLTTLAISNVGITAFATGRVTTNEELVCQVQQVLNETGYECGVADGKAGSATYAALNNYQKDQGLEVENAITDSLLIHMGILKEKSTTAIDPIEIVLSEDEEIVNIGDNLYAVFPNNWYESDVDTVKRLYSVENGGENSALLMYYYNNVDTSASTYDEIEEAFNIGLQNFNEDGYHLNSEEKNILLAGNPCRIGYVTKMEGDLEIDVTVTQLMTENNYYIIAFYQPTTIDVDLQEKYQRVLDTIYCDPDGSITENIMKKQISSDITNTQGQVSDNESVVISEVKTENDIVQYIFEKPLLVADNEHIKMEITGKMYVDPNNNDGWGKSGGAVGFSYIIENKTPDASFEVWIEDASVDGFMLDSQARPINTIDSIAAGKKAKGFIYIPLDGRNLGVDISTIEDFHDFDGYIKLLYKEEGSAGYGLMYHGETTIPQKLMQTIP